jgi:hypothetical protein
VLKIREITTELVRERLSRKLKHHIGRGLDYEYAEASRVLDTDQRTIQSWVGNERSPHVEGLLRLFMLPDVGPEIANEVLQLAGLQAIPMTDGNPCPFDAGKHITSAASRLLEMLEDGRIDHLEDPEWQDIAIALASKLLTHVNARRRASAKGAA